MTDGASRLATLPSVLSSVPAQAHAFRLAGVALPPDEDDVRAAVEAFQVICYQGMIAVNSEYELEGKAIRCDRYFGQLGQKCRLHCVLTNKRNYSYISYFDKIARLY